MVWDPHSATLTGIQEGSVGTTYAPFEHKVTLYVPEGFVPSEERVSAPAGYTIEHKGLSFEGHVATLRFTVAELQGDCPPNEACKHPDLTWSIAFK